MIASGCTIGYTVAAILTYKSKYQVDPKVFWEALRTAIYALALSIVVYVIVPKPVVIIILLNVAAMSYALYRIFTGNPPKETGGIN
jgi:hypothetical protein